MPQLGAGRLKGGLGVADLATTSSLEPAALSDKELSETAIAAVVRCSAWFDVAALVVLISILETAVRTLRRAPGREGLRPYHSPGADGDQQQFGCTSPFLTGIDPIPNSDGVVQQQAGDSGKDQE